MTLCKAIDEKRMDLICEFTLYLREACDFSVQQIKKVFEKPHNWEQEFSEWITLQFGQTVFVPQFAAE